MSENGSLIGGSGGSEKPATGGENACGCSHPAGSCGGENCTCVTATTISKTEGAE